MNKLKFFFSIIGLTAIDQLTKMLVSFYKSKLPVQIIKGVFNLTYCENRGIAFGLASGYARIISIFTLVILTVIIFICYINFNKINKLTCVGIAMLIAGGFGNFIDRAFKSYVVDFINFIKFPIFNIADICVVFGVITIGVTYLSYRKN